MYLLLHKPTDVCGSAFHEPVSAHGRVIQADNFGFPSVDHWLMSDESFCRAQYLENFPRPFGFLLYLLFTVQTDSTQKFILICCFINMLSEPLHDEIKIPLSVVLLVSYILTNKDNLSFRPVNSWRRPEIAGRLLCIVYSSGSQPGVRKQFLVGRQD